MKKNLIALSCIAAFATTSFSSDANTEMFKQIQALKAQIEALEKKVAAQETVQIQKVEPAVTTVDEKRIEKIEKKLDTVSKQQLQLKFKVLKIT